MRTTSFPTFSGVVLVGMWQCQAMPVCYHITLAQDRALKAVKWTPTQWDAALSPVLC